ncbi:MAG: LPS export ABC transporter periplasmic protein LptC [Armatimonadota bacterium]|nr:LPS export ABC transporter periplasmic protein LptC [Armatimonadota bacterium]
MGTRRAARRLVAPATVAVVVAALLHGPGVPARTPVSAFAAQDAPGARPAQHAVPPLEVRQTAITSVDAQGRRQWELQAQTVVVDNAAGVAVLTAVRGTYYKTGEPAISFSAPRGRFDLASREVVLSGGVRAQSTTGRRVFAETVRWFPRTHELEAIGRVVLEQGTWRIQADYLRADVTLQRTTLRGNIRATVTEEAR